MPSLTRRGVTRLSAALLAAAGALAFGLGATAANATSIRPLHSLSAETPFCATQAPTADEAAAKSAAITSTCFPSQGEALAAATGDESYKSLTNEEAFSLVVEGTRAERGALSTPVPLSTALLSVDSVDWHYEGATNYWYGQATGCCYYIGDGMNDRTSSETWG